MKDSYWRSVPAQRWKGRGDGFGEGTFVAAVQLDRQGAALLGSGVGEQREQLHDFTFQIQIARRSFGWTIFDLLKEEIQLGCVGIVAQIVQRTAGVVITVSVPALQKLVEIGPADDDLGEPCRLAGVTESVGGALGIDIAADAALYMAQIW